MTYKFFQVSIYFIILQGPTQGSMETSICFLESSHKKVLSILEKVKIPFWTVCSKSFGSESIFQGMI